MEGAIVSVAFCIALSVAGLMGVICSVGFKLIKVLDEIKNILKEKTQSEDCVKDNKFNESQTKLSTRVDKINKF